LIEDLVLAAPGYNHQMLVSSQGLAAVVRLYRGDTLESQALVRRHGIRADGNATEDGFPAFPFCTLTRLPPEVLQMDADEHVLAHVVRRGPSPLVSMTSSEDVARRYALADGRRRNGILISAWIHLRESHSWHVPDRGRSVVYVDERGRRWLDLARYRSSSVEAYIGSGAWSAFHASATRDHEWLLLGSLRPGEVSLTQVTVPWWQRLMAS
jgi:hypothetical protein